MRVICLEGSHGCGKTELIAQLIKLGYNTLDEGFLDMPKYSLDPQSFVMESIWVTRWIERVLNIQKMQGNNDNAIYFADRSPYSVLLYALNGKLMEPVITEQLMDLLNSDIEIIIIHISVNNTLLWQRIQERLVREPMRLKYHEGEYGHMIKAQNFYRENHLWDYTVENNGSPDDTVRAVLNIAQI